jgi:hypothetical protein
MSDYLRHSYEHIQASEDMPFGTDMLKRKKFADFLTQVATKYSSGFVMAINGTWGTGKTVLMHQWMADLKKKGYRVTLFNAWDNDYFGEPTLAILSQFKDLFDENHKLPEKVVAVWKTLQKVPQAVIKGLAYKQAENIVGDAALKQITDDYKSNNEIDSHYKESDIGNYLTQRIDFINYKSALIRFAQGVYDEEQKPIVFIIDELDRCKPSYAVEVLEKIKHLFNIPNIVFCVAVDREQLINSIKGYYGSHNFNAEEYLRRFFDVDLDLPPIEYNEFAYMLAEHFDLKRYLLKDSELNEFVQISADMGKKTHLTLRQMEKYFAHAKLVFSFYKTEKDSRLVAIMLVLHKFAHELYLNIVNRELELKDYADSLKWYFDFKEFSTGPCLLGAFLYHIDCYLQDGRHVPVDEDFKLPKLYNFSEKELERMSRAYIAEDQNYNSYSILSKIISHINFVEQTVAKVYE